MGEKTSEEEARTEDVRGTGVRGRAATLAGGGVGAETGAGVGAGVGASGWSLGQEWLTC